MNRGLSAATLPLPTETSLPYAAGATEGVRRGTSSSPHLLPLQPETIERRSPGASKDEEGASDEQHPVQVTRVPPCSKGKLHPHCRHEHLHSEQGADHTGEQPQDEEDAAYEFQARNEWGHQARKGDRDLCKVGRHVPEPTGELLVTVNGEKEPGHDAHNRDAPIRQHTSDAFHSGSPYVPPCPTIKA